VRELADDEARGGGGHAPADEQERRAKACDLAGRTGQRVPAVLVFSVLRDGRDGRRARGAGRQESRRPRGRSGRERVGVRERMGLRARVARRERDESRLKSSACGVAWRAGWAERRGQDGDEVDRGWRLEAGLRELMFPGGYKEDLSAPWKKMRPVSTNEEEGEEGDSELVAILALNEVGATRVPQRAQARSGRVAFSAWS
jgi:hypothetical protein